MAKPFKLSSSLVTTVLCLAEVDLLLFTKETDQPACPFHRPAPASLPHTALHPSLPLPLLEIPSLLSPPLLSLVTAIQAWFAHIAHLDHLRSRLSICDFDQQPAGTFMCTTNDSFGAVIACFFEHQLLPSPIMNKENCHPNMYILKRREDHLSLSRSIPSIFRRKKRARTAQLQPSNHHTPKHQLKHDQPHLRGRKTRPVVESVNPHQPAKLQCTLQSMACEPKCNSRGLPADHERNGKLNEGDHSVSPKDLSIRKNENQDGTYSQKLERRVTRTSEGDRTFVLSTVQRAATGTNEGNRSSKIFEDISNEITLESDHSGSLQRPESHSYAPSSQCQTVTENK